MRDNYEGDALPAPEENEAGAAGEVVRRPRLAVGARATIMMGMAISAVAAVAAFLPGQQISSVSSP